MDRRRQKREQAAADKEKAQVQTYILEEFKKEVCRSLGSLSLIDEDRGTTGSAWDYYNGIILNHQVQLKVLANAAIGRVNTHLAISRAANSLSFANLPLEHMQLWYESIAIAKDELQASSEML